MFCNRSKIAFQESLLYRNSAKTNGFSSNFSKVDKLPKYGEMKPFKPFRMWINVDNSVY